MFTGRPDSLTGEDDRKERVGAGEITDEIQQRLQNLVFSQRFQFFQNGIQLCPSGRHCVLNARRSSENEE